MPMEVSEILAVRERSILPRSITVLSRIPILAANQISPYNLRMLQVWSNTGKDVCVAPFSVWAYARVERCGDMA